MPDIAKCDSQKCPMRESCYRQSAPDSMRQSYADFYELQGDDCEQYIPIKWEPKGAA